MRFSATGTINPLNGNRAKPAWCQAYVSPIMLIRSLASGTYTGPKGCSQIVRNNESIYGTALYGYTNHEDGVVLLIEGRGVSVKKSRPSFIISWLYCAINSDDLLKPKKGHKKTALTRGALYIIQLFSF